MEQLTLEQTASCYIDEYSKNIPATHSWHDSLSLSFKAGAEWKKEQLKAKWETMSNLMENGLAKELVDRVAAQLLQD